MFITATSIYKHDNLDISYFKSYLSILVNIYF